MKKPSFDSAKLKRFFVLHGEKLALGVFFLLFVGMVYGALGTKIYDKTPQQLRNDTMRIEGEVTSAPFDPTIYDVVFPNPPYAVQAQVAMAPLDAKPFMLSTLFNNPNSENKVRRDEPKYFAVNDLRATYGTGAVKLKTNGYVGKRWVVVTGLIPYVEQLTEYKKLFDNAMFTKPELDAPQYDGFEVERAEITPGSSELAWQPIDVIAAIGKELKEFAGAGERPIVVDRKFMEQFVCEPLPPLVGSQPDASMAHEPEIPFALQVKDKETEQKPAAEQAKPADVDNPLKQLGENFQPPAVQVIGPAAGSGTAAKPEVTPVRLFRFFDYSVEDMKSYRYRVKVHLKNPNEGVAVRFLKKPELADGKLRPTDWSKPSTTASVPTNFRVLAGEVKVPAGAGEPKGNVLMLQWVPEKGVEVPHEFGGKGTEIYRGTLMNFADTSVLIPVPGKADTVEGTVSFITNTLLLDFVGGENVSLDKGGRTFKSPSQLAFMGPDGEVFIKTQADDAPEYAERKPVVQAAARVKDEDKPDEPAGGNKPPKRGGLFDLK